ncbi:hypothetical protein HD554DRAFT_356267 [Boletus coccyginus]|nr:hypothetical protein HD554DRAFT_356267 [Boletus coccyginus]
MSALTSSQIMGDMLVLRAMTYSSYALLVWDYLLTLDDEITYIWGGPSSVVKYLFIGNRYVNLLVQPVYISDVAGVLPLGSSATCVAFSWTMALSQFWSYGSVHVLVLLRVWVLYGRTLKITTTLTAAFILYLCASIALVAYILGALNHVNSAPGWTCQGELAPFSWLIWIVEFTLEACLFGLTIFTLRQQKSRPGFLRVSRLVRSLYRHAIIFFLANTLSDILNTIAWTAFAGTPLYNVAISFSISLVNITGQRLAIDLRRLRIQKDITESEIGRVVEIQLAAFDDLDPEASNRP